MKNGEQVNYRGTGLLLVRRYRGWLKWDEFWSDPHDRLTLIPITRPKKFQALRRLWRAAMPDLWRRFWTHRSHVKFLVQNGVVDKEEFKWFGTDKHLEDIKARLKDVPTPATHNNGFDARHRSRDERRALLHKQIMEAVEASKDTQKVTHLRPSNEQIP